MTGTIRKNSSKPLRRVNHDKEAKRPRVVSMSCEGWTERRSAGRRDFDYWHGYRQRSCASRYADSARKRREMRRHRRVHRDTVYEDIAHVQDPSGESWSDDDEIVGSTQPYHNDWSDYDDTGLGIWPPLTDEELGLPNRGVLRMIEDLKRGAVWAPLTDEEFESYHREESEMIELARTVGCNI